MNYKVVTLTTGEEIQVFAPPLNAWDLVKKRYPDPEPPIVEEKTASGSTIAIKIVDDPGYLAEKERVARLQSDLYQDVCALGALRKIVVPEGFDAEAEFGEIMRYADPDWQPREGKGGRKLDYIDYALLTNTKDVMAIQEAMTELMGVEPEEVEAVVASFPDQVEG
jgi:hypothetical protein